MERRMDGRKAKLLLVAATLGAIAIALLATGCAVRRIYATRGVMFRNPVFSPDGSSILVEASGDLFLFRPDGTLINNLTNGVGKNSNARWSPNGQWLLFISDRDGQKDIYRMRSDGADVTNLTKSAADEDYAVWSPDGKHILFFRCGPRRANGHCDGGHLIIAHVDGTGERIFAKDGWQAWWSPDNRWIAYLDVNGKGIWIQSPDGGGRRRLVEGRPIAWSPDGNAIFYRPPRGGSDKNTHVRRINLDGIGDKLVLENYSTDEWWGGDPQHFWNPSGSLLALVVYLEIGVRDGGVVIVDREGNVVGDFRERQSGFDYNHTASWSPDGNWVLFRKSFGYPRTGWIGGVYMLNVRTGEQRQVLADKVQFVEIQP